MFIARIKYLKEVKTFFCTAAYNSLTGRPAKKTALFHMTVPASTPHMNFHIFRFVTDTLSDFYGRTMTPNLEIYKKKGALSFTDGEVIYTLP